MFQTNQLWLLGETRWPGPAMLSADLPAMEEVAPDAPRKGSCSPAASASTFFSSTCRHYSFMGARQQVQHGSLVSAVICVHGQALWSSSESI